MLSPAEQLRAVKAYTGWSDQQIANKLSWYEDTPVSRVTVCNIRRGTGRSNGKRLIIAIGALYHSLELQELAVQRSVDPDERIQPQAQPRRQPAPPAPRPVPRAAPAPLAPVRPPVRPQIPSPIETVSGAQDRRATSGSSRPYNIGAPAGSKLFPRT